MIVHTGQHYDARLSDDVLADLDFPRRRLLPRRRLGLARRADREGHRRLRGRAARRSGPVAVVVAGDVNSTLACALVAAKLGIPVAHIESGLRSGDWTMPEEVNRVLTDALSDLLFTHSPEGETNLAAEGIGARPRALRRQHDDRLAAPLRAPRPCACRLGDRRCGRGKYVLVTLHRPSNVDEPAAARAHRRRSARARPAPPDRVPDPSAHARPARRHRRARPPGGRRRPLHRAAGLPRLPLAAGRRRRRPDGLRWRAGGDVGARRGVLHAASEHRASRHDHARARTCCSATTRR